MLTADRRLLMTIASSAHYSEIIQDMANSHISSSMDRDTTKSHISSEMVTRGEMDAEDDDAESKVHTVRALDERKAEKKDRKTSPVLQLGTPSLSTVSAFSDIDDIPVLNLTTSSGEQMTSPELDMDLSDASSLSDVDESHFVETNVGLDLDLSDASSLSDVDESHFAGMGW
jgi:dynactin complex subunit